MDFYIRVAEGTSTGIGGGFARILLIPLSWVYGMVIGIRHWLFDRGYFKRYRSLAPVISIGNITWGGTAKTSLVMYLSEYFLKSGRKVAVLSRGYSSDEPALIQKRFSGRVPVFQGKDRVTIVKQIESDYSPVILDDGFQYRSIDPRLSIVLINAASPLPQYLLPAGIYRDTLRQLGRADIVLFTATDMVSRERLQALHVVAKRFNAHAPLFNARYQAQGISTQSGDAMSIDSLRDVRLGMIASIAFPAGLRHKIQQLGLRVTREFVYPDHYRFSGNEIGRASCRERV